MIPPRLTPLLRQLDFACGRLTDRLRGPAYDSGDGTPTAATPMTEEEFVWVPAPDVTTIAWRLSHLSEMLTLRADHTSGSHRRTRDDYVAAGDAPSAIKEFTASAALWRNAVLSVDDAGLDTIGVSTYPHGSDPDEPFLDIVWWVNQEVLHHGAEIALLRDLYRAR